MAERDEVLRGYAEALFAVADAEGELDTIEALALFGIAFSFII